MTPKEHDRRIDYIEIPVSDIDEAKRFYGKVFGWTFKDYGPDYTSFEDGRLSGGFAKSGTIVPGGPLVVMFALDLEAVEKSVVEHGGAITKKIFDFPGGRRFHFRGPSGHELAVWTDR